MLLELQFPIANKSCLLSNYTMTDTLLLKNEIKMYMSISNKRPRHHLILDQWQVNSDITYND